MKKDTGIALFFGFVLGLLVAAVVVNMPGLFKNGFKLHFTFPKIALFSKKSNPVQPTPTAAFAGSLEITQPADRSVSDTAKITLSGKAKPETTIVVDTSGSDQILTIDHSGLFKLDLTLDEGANKILVTNYTNRDTAESKMITVSYTPEKF